jgi:heme/copper-type cytochrome/quinol oxidase subunit 2
VDASGRAIPLTQLLGGSGGGVFGATGPAAAAQQQANAFVVWIAQFIGAFVGLLVADWLVGFLWGVWFKNARVQAWEPLKLVAIVLVAIGAASLPTGWNLW